MPEEALLIGISAIAVAMAGFAAVASAFSPAGGGWPPAHRIRLRAIVSTSFNVMFESLLPVVLYPAFGDARTALAVASLIVGIYAVFVVTIRGRQIARVGGLRNRTTAFLFAAGPTATALFLLNALVFASVTVFALALLIQLSVAAISFYSLVATGSG